MNKSNRFRAKMYLDVAKMIASDMSYGGWFVCELLGNGQFPEFQLFKPAESSFEGGAWFHESSSCGVTYGNTAEIEEGNKQRILALLFSHQIALNP